MTPPARLGSLRIAGRNSTAGDGKRPRADARRNAVMGKPQRAFIEEPSRVLVNSSPVLPSILVPALQQDGMMHLP